MNRRAFVAGSLAAGLAPGLTPGPAGGVSAAVGAEANPPPEPRANRLKQSVCRWCFGSTPLDALCDRAKAIGLRSVELLGPDEWPVAKARGLECAVATFVRANPIHRGFNRAEHHDAIVRDLEERLPLVKDAGIPCQIVFSGNRAGLSDEEGLAACAAGLRRVTPLAESLGVTLVMELLNSKVDHRDYQCDRTAWGVELVKRVASDRFRLLYDIYHMQIMEGDVIRTITEHGAWIAHYHTAGVPGRHELDDSQELNYGAICRAIVATAYTGFLGQEFIPVRDPFTSLAEAFKTCDV